jgi:hypothetical protein
METQGELFVCPSCGAAAYLTVQDLLEIGRPLCTECDDDGIEMEVE